MSGDEKLSTVEDSNPEEASGTDSGYDLETYRHAIEEARRSWDQLLAAYNDVAQKSWRIVRLNGIVATIYIAAIANALPNLEVRILTVGIIGAGLVSLAVSTYLAVIVQQTEDVSVGQGPEALERVREYDPDEITYLYETLRMYKEKIGEVANQTKQNGSTVNRAMSLSLIGVGLLTIGTLLAIVL